jgi:hypothetical protein
MAVMPTIRTPTPDPVPIDPDIVNAGRDRALIINIRRLIGDIAFDFAAGNGDTTSYRHDH